MHERWTDRLSEYLRAVRGGRVVTVLDRDTPIARITPVERASRLTSHGFFRISNAVAARAVSRMSQTALQRCD